MKFKYFFTLTKLIFIVAVPLVLLILPAGFFDNGKSLCLSKLLLNVECFACGMSRACMHLIHLDFEEAYAYNMASFLALPALAIVWVQWFLKEWKMYKRYRYAMAAQPANE